MLGSKKKSFVDSQPQDDLNRISSDNTFSDEKKFIELIKALSCADFVAIDNIIPQDEHLSRAFSVGFESYLDRISTAALPAEVEHAINTQVPTKEFIKKMILKK